ncbi:hypothetical protein Unana1_05357 [Umbelopsis nana]
MTAQRLPAIKADVSDSGNQMYNLMNASNSTSTMQYAGFDPAPDLSIDESGTTPTKPGVQRGKLYYGWTKSRWSLLVSNIVFMAYSIFFLVASLATYGKAYSSAEVIVAANSNILGVTLGFAIASVLTSAIGMAGIIRKDRRLLVGYLGYKQDTWNLKSKLGMQWRYSLTNNGRVAIQNNLRCCGFENPSDHATYFARCFPKSLLPGCQHKLYLFESSLLQIAYTVAFSLVPLQLIIMIVSMLCSNHVTLRFGRRARPHIAYLEGHSDWRSWEIAQKKEKGEPAGDCDAKGMPYQFSPIDLYSSGGGLEDEKPRPQSTSSALGEQTAGRGATRKRSAHRNVQR